MTERDATTAMDDDPTVDTIVLLQQEIERLEAEIHSRDRAEVEPFEAPPLTTECDAPERLELHRRIEELTAELATRDETIHLLLDQARLFEEAAAAERAEWEQLHQWMSEVERRVEQNDDGGSRSATELEAERRRSESLLRQLDTDRRVWEAQKRHFEEEVGRLRAAQGTESEDAAFDQMVANLELENQHLRARCAELDGAAALADEVEHLREQLSDTLTKMDAARVELRRSEDKRRLDQNEHEATVSGLKSQLARQTLHATVLTPETSESATGNPAVEADMRIRAFREHLKELHDRDEEDRAKQGLAARLSRLWSRTGPSH